MQLPISADGVATEVAQPAIVTSALMALDCLAALGITAEVSIGHSLGELCALHWAGAFDGRMLQRLATERGRIIARHGRAGGTMIRLGCRAEAAMDLAGGLPLSLACHNGPEDTVLAGPEAAAAELLARASAAAIAATPLRVSHAFHTIDMTPALEPWRAALDSAGLGMPRGRVISTLTGQLVSPEADLPAMLVTQLIEPVRFAEAISAAGEVELWIEAGAGTGLARLAAATTGGVPAVSTDAGGPSLVGLLAAAGAAFALGAPVEASALFRDRFLRPFDIAAPRRFLANPCEQAPPALSGRPAPEVPPAGPPAATAEQPASAPDTLELLRGLVAGRAELAPALVTDDAQMLSDLHLNSITVAEVVAEACRRSGRAVPVALTDYADARLIAIAGAIAELPATRPSGGGAEARPTVPASSLPWVRAFETVLVETEASPPPAAAGVGGWRIREAGAGSLAGAMDSVARQMPGEGLVLCLGPAPDIDALTTVLAAVQETLAGAAPRRFVLVQHGAHAGALARTLFQEARDLPVCIATLPAGCDHLAPVVLREAAATEAFTEIEIDAVGVVRRPVLQPRSQATAGATAGPPELDEGDVLLVTGGGKGITAEIALALARRWGLRLAILGRSQPEEDAGLAANLERMRRHGVELAYLVADVSDPQVVRAAVAEAERSLGPIVGVIHGAAQNRPVTLRGLDRTELEATLGPKVIGARNLLAVLEPRQLRLFLALGSVLARTGLPAAGAYALANEMLADLVSQLGDTLPRCRCLVVESSIWSEVGMGVRLGSVDRLAGIGVNPISPDQGIEAILRLTETGATGRIVLSSRMGHLPTLCHATASLPLLRFLERSCLHYPGIELVVEAELSHTTDPYLADHVVGGEYILPAVIGLEAMAQAATGLLGTLPLGVSAARFERPVVIPPGRTETLQLAATQREDGSVAVALRASSTGFRVDHMRADFLLEEPVTGEPTAPPRPTARSVDLNPEGDLYGSLLAHGPRFRRVTGYSLLHARECVAAIEPAPSARWFATGYAGRLVLGDPAARDAAIHAIQACIPHSQLVPVAIERISRGRAGPGPWSVSAQECARDGKTFIYDVVITAADGQLVERLEGLCLRVVGSRPAVPASSGWGLLVPFLERRVEELSGTQILADLRDSAEEPRTVRSDALLARQMGLPAMSHRPDGRRDGNGGMNVSLSHAGSVTLALAGACRISCDLESVPPTPDTDWRSLLGQERWQLARHIASECQEPEDAAATRIWAAAECIKKIGGPSWAPLQLSRADDDGCVVLRTGDMVITTIVTDSPRGRLAVSALTEEAG